MAKIIQLKNVSHYSGEQKLLEHVSLEIEQGHFVTLAGSAGKSTLLQLIAGALAPHKGELKVLGQVPSAAQFRYKAEIFFVHQDFQMTFPVTLREIMEIYAQVFPRWQSKYFSQMLQQRCLGFDTCFTDLSWAQRNELLIIIALAARPKILLMDEAAIKLSKEHKNYFFGHLKSFSQDGGTVVMGHNKSEQLAGLSDHHLVLVDGRLIDQGPRESEELLAFSPVRKFAA